MNHNRFDISLAKQYPVRSLFWRGDELIDLATGGRRFALDGTIQTSRFSISYPFNAAVASPSGRFAATYERTGTKGLLFEKDKLIREFNRSYYQAQAYEYPLTFLQDENGNEFLIHCPDKYNRLEIEDPISGRRLEASRERKPSDFFQSRLSISPNGLRLMSAGWAWHPFDLVRIWNIADALTDVGILDYGQWPKERFDTEVNSAVFMDDQRLLVAADSDAENRDEEMQSPFVPGVLATYNLSTHTFETAVSVQEPVGTMLWLEQNQVVSFYNHPKVLDIATGQVLFEWPEIASGQQKSSIFSSSPPPPIALDPINRRFAVASEESISVIQML